MLGNIKGAADLASHIWVSSQKGPSALRFILTEIHALQMHFNDLPTHRHFRQIKAQMRPRVPAPNFLITVSAWESGGSGETQHHSSQVYVRELHLNGVGQAINPLKLTIWFWPMTFLWELSYMTYTVKIYVSYCRLTSWMAMNFGIPSSGCGTKYILPNKISGWRCTLQKHPVLLSQKHSSSYGSHIPIAKHPWKHLWRHCKSVDVVAVFHLGRLSLILLVNSFPKKHVQRTEGMNGCFFTKWFCGPISLGNMDPLLFIAIVVTHMCLLSDS